MKTVVVSINLNPDSYNYAKSHFKQPCTTFRALCELIERIDRKTITLQEIRDRIKMIEDNPYPRGRGGLKHTDVKAIRRHLARGKKQAEVARMFNVSRKVICNIANGLTYKGVE